MPHFPTAALYFPTVLYFPSAVLYGNKSTLLLLVVSHTEYFKCIYAGMYFCCEDTNHVHLPTYHNSMQLCAWECGNGNNTLRHLLVPAKINPSNLNPLNAML